MAQILIKRSAVAAKVPATADIALGELAINTYDGKLYLKKSVAGVETVVQVGDPTTAPVQTVFGRVGNVVLQSSDVTGALGFTPYRNTGGVLTGNMTFINDAEGITWNRNTDGASILFYNTGDTDPESRMEFQVKDNGTEYFRWTRIVGSTTTNDMELRNGNLNVLGTVTAAGFSGPLTGAVTGNASSATILQTTRSISATGDATWSVNFNGSANASAALTLANSGVTAGTYNSVTVDAKGRVTGASNISATTQLGYTPVNKAGDTMTGQLNLVGGRFFESTGTAGIWAQNSDIIGVNGLYFEDIADGIGEGINFYRDATHWDTLFMASGSLYIQRNRTHNAVGTNDTVLHSANFNTYAPTLTGTGASGSWSINASTATTLATTRTIAHSGDMTGSATFNGSANITIPMTLANSGVTAGTYTKLTVDAKGRATAGTQLTASDVTTALGYTPSSSSEAGTAGGYATLDANGKLNSSQVPAIAIVDTFVVADQAAMLALSTADVGDVAVRTDVRKSFILKTAGASTLANWQELLTPTDVVTSVAGRTGAVTLTMTDISGTLPVTKGGTGVTTSTGTGSVVLSTNPTFAGTASFASLQASGGITISNGADGMVNLGGDANGTLELGKVGRAVAGTPYIDFHSAANSGDYDARIIVSGGDVTQGGGTATMNIIAKTLTFNGAHLGKAGDLGTGYDFNGYTVTGTWYQNSDANAATATNSPSVLSGKLTVENSGNTIGIWQTYDTYRNSSTPRQFRRQYYNGAWSAWSETLTTTNGPAVNPATPSDGDVQVAAGPTISIYASGAWRQIFPAVYS
jgi:hypothetical protein